MKHPVMQMVLTTIDRPEAAQELGRKLIQSRLSVCVNILPGVMSVYQWQGRVEETAEQIMLIKTLPDMTNSVVSYLETHHPYEVPEILVLDVNDINPGYLNWARNIKDQR